MNRLVLLLMGFLTAFFSTVVGESADEFSIKQIMQKAHVPGREAGKQRLYKVVLEGTATKEQKQELVDLYEALSKAKPTKGSLESWQKFNAPIVAAAREILSGEAKDGAKLQTALNCQGCHDAHKPVYESDGTIVKGAGSFGTAAPPQFVKLANISKDKLTISVLYYESVPVTSYKEEEVEMGGVFKKVQVPVTQMRPTMRQGLISLAYVRLFDSTGKEVKGDEVWQRLKPGMTFLRQTESKEIDPALLKLLSPDALILAPSVLESPPAGK